MEKDILLTIRKMNNCPMAPANANRHILATTDGCLETKSVNCFASPDANRNTIKHTHDQKFMFIIICCAVGFVSAFIRSLNYMLKYINNQ